MAFIEPPSVLIGVVLNHACQDADEGDWGIDNSKTKTSNLLFLSFEIIGLTCLIFKV